MPHSGTKEDQPRSPAVPHTTRQHPRSPSLLLPHLEGEGQDEGGSSNQRPVSPRPYAVPRSSAYTRGGATVPGAAPHPKPRRARKE